MVQITSYMVETSPELTFESSQWIEDDNVAESRLSCSKKIGWKELGPGHYGTIREFDFQGEHYCTESHMFYKEVE